MGRRKRSIKARQSQVTTEENEAAENDDNEPPMKSPRINDDNEVEDQEDMDLDENDAAEPASVQVCPSPQAIRQTIASPLRTVNRAGKPAEAGIIKRVQVENFMCHRKLTVELCRNVNFIHGQNGSGKSAVLAAIQICLGAGARRTHRARNLKDLIRKGGGGSADTNRSAKVRVTLYNEGADAYEHDLYGDELTVERTIASSTGGFNGYRLLDQDGNERSRLKKDLDAMLDQLNVQVENPVAVLDQEEAKKFLMGKPEDKYAFFMKATELERLDRTYAAIGDNLIQMEEDQGRIRSTLTVSESHVKKLEKEWNAYKDMEKMADTMAVERVNFAWSLVKQCQHDYDEAFKKKQDIEEKLNARRLDLAHAKESLEESPEFQKQLQLKSETLTKEAQDSANEKHDLEAQIQIAKQPVKQAEQELFINKRELKQAQNAFAQARKNLKEARDQIEQLAGSAESDAARRAKRIREAEEARDDTKVQMENIKANVELYLAQYEELEPQVESAFTTTQGAESQMQAVGKRLKELERSAQNSIAIFGSKCVLMHQKVEEARRAGKFTGPVVGPIGNFLKVVPGKEHLAALAEVTLGRGILDRFIVTNTQDSRTFRQIRERAGVSGRECNMFQVTPVPRYKIPDPPCDGIDTVATVLNVSDDLVFNCLIDNCAMELNALATSKEDSEEKLLSQDAHGRESILGRIKQVYFLPHGDFWKVQNGFRTMQSNPNGKRGLKQTIGVDRTAAIAEAMREFEQLKQEVNEHRLREERIKNQLRTAKKNWNQETQEFNKRQKRIIELEQEIETIKEEQETADNFDIDTSELEEDVRQSELKMKELQEREVQLKKVIEELAPLVKERQAKLEEITARNLKISVDLQALEQEMDAHVKSDTEKKRKIAKKEEIVQKIVAILEQHTKELISHEDKVKVSTQKAKRVTLRVQREIAFREATAAAQHGGTPIPDLNAQEFTEEELEAVEYVETDKTPEKYQAKLKRLEQQVERERQKRNISETDVTALYEKYIRARDELMGKLASIKQIEENIDQLAKDLVNRKQRWKQFRRHIAMLTNHTFDEILNKKGSSGEIDFDHKQQRLNLVVQKDNMNEASQTKDVKALSGGERSFTTLSLLLALGENLETPFRVMDEFDVFLDPVARRIALQTMIEIGKTMEHRQFIFITPQDLSSIDRDNQVRIIQLRPPDRSGTQQTLD